MVIYTHVAFSTFCYLSGATIFEYPVKPIELGLAALFSIMPDIDLPTSQMGRLCFWASIPLERRFGHRTITHSLVGVGLLAVIMVVFISLLAICTEIFAPFRTIFAPGFAIRTEIFAPSIKNSNLNFDFLGTDVSQIFDRSEYLTTDVSQDFSTYFDMYFGSYFWAILGGYWSHIQIDMLNIRGVDLFWPSPIRVVMPGKYQYRLEVGSKAEMVFLSFLLVFCVGLYFTSEIGIRGIMHNLLHDFDLEYDEYLHKQGLNWYTIKIKAVDNLTLEHVECDCPVIGTWQGGLIIKFNGKKRALGKTPQHNLYPLHTVLINGEPLRIISQRVDMQAHSLRWLIDNLNGKRNYYILGKLQVSANPSAITDIETYHPLIMSDKVMILNYATADDLVKYKHIIAISGEIVIQFWLTPKDEPVVANFTSEQNDLIPEALEAIIK